jgi:hypothetical protein
MRFLYFKLKFETAYCARHYISFFLWDLPVVKISPECVTGPEQGESSGRVATFSLWTGVFKDGISSIPGETVIPLWLGLVSVYRDISNIFLVSWVETTVRTNMC